MNFKVRAESYPHTQIKLVNTEKMANNLGLSLFKSSFCPVIQSEYILFVFLWTDGEDHKKGGAWMNGVGLSNNNCDK